MYYSLSIQDCTNFSRLRGGRKIPGKDGPFSERGIIITAGLAEVLPVNRQNVLAMYG